MLKLSMAETREELFIKLKDIPSQEIMPGFRGKLFHSDTMTVAFWEIDPGMDLPEHSHEHEQISNVLEGEFELTIDGVSKVMGPGDSAVIPSNAVHSGKSITACKVIDVFSPVREDYKI